MTPKTFIWVAVSTAVALAAVAVSLGRDTGYRPVAGAGEKVFPGLLERVNDVARITIENADGKITLENGTQGWTMKDREGYPARTVKIKRSVLGLAQLQLSEAKTRRPEKYAKLELQDISAPGTNKGAKSKRVKLFDGAGKVGADLLVGKRRGALAGTPGGGLYVRTPGDQQTWLAAGDADFSGSPENWLERKIVNIKGARVQTVVIRHPDGETVKLSKAAEETKDFTLEALPEGKKVILQFALDAIGKALADLQLDDVKKDNGGFDDDTAAGKVTAIEYLTFDGLFVQVRVVKRDGAHWLRLEATGEAAEEITARTKGWVYKVSDYTASTLTKRLADLIEDEKPKS